MTAPSTPQAPARAPADLMRAAVMRAVGEPDVLVVEQMPLPVPEDGQSLVDVSFAGINFDDLERRGGDTPAPDLPAVLGVDVVGRRRRDGQRVVVLMRHGGGYAQVVAATDAYSIDVPEDITDEQALGIFEQGATAYGALALAGRIRTGESVAISAAAGGVGHLAVQLAVALGARQVIGIASTAAKRALVTELGAHHALVPDDLDEGLREVTGGRGVDLVVDATGGDQTRALLRGLAPFGRLVSYGWRAPGPGRGTVSVSTEELTDRSIGCAGFWMRHVVDDRPRLSAIAQELFRLAGQGRLRAHIDRVVALGGVGAAHAAIAARATSGKVLIDVNRER
ncbi:quinone oxidoreductase family protein [Actinokineospora diospyrosa]|uniref:NADPH2:quinone reductase n=1 Tax=Actinokineospora diospyrosa TaxID=103728 RepID=A0ABT1IBZ1_9PSEU|nr:zinc-binding dehydrogenase [Actinokineospora diospyrosa]MCP2270142.1 NADPH2:quinone reductase [Actinokineospora diospyrosa]